MTTIRNIDNIQSGNTNGSVYNINITDIVDLQDISGLVIEFFDISTTLQIDPSYGAITEEDVIVEGFDAEAVAYIECNDMDVSWSYDLSSVFQYTFDSSDVDDISSTDIVFNIDKEGLASFFEKVIKNSNGIGVSNAEIISGSINTIYSTTQKIKYDIPRHLSYSITGGYSSADIFANEDELRKDVEDRDDEIYVSISGQIDDILKDYTLSDSGNDSRIYKLQNSLLKNILRNGTSTNNSVWRSKYIELLNQLHENSQDNQNDLSTNTASLALTEGDAICIKVKYNPPSADAGLNAGTMTARSYKILLILSNQTGQIMDSDIEGWWEQSEPEPEPEPEPEGDGDVDEGISSPEPEGYGDVDEGISSPEPEPEPEPEGDGDVDEGMLVSSPEPEPEPEPEGDDTETNPLM